MRGTRDVFVTVHLELDMYAVILREGGALAKRLAYLFQRLLLRNVFRQTIRPHFHARGSEVVRERDPCLCLVDVLAQDGRVRRVIFADRPETTDFHGRVLKPRPHLRACGWRERDLDAMLVRRPELHGVNPGLCKVLDERREIPVLRNVVRDGAELQTGPCRGRPGRLHGLDRSKGRKGASGEKVSRLFMARA